MEYEISTNGLISRIALNTEYSGWREQLAYEVREMVMNGFISNYMRIGDVTVFSMQEFVQNHIIPLQDAHKVWVKADWSEEDVWLGRNKNRDGSIIEGYWKYDDTFEDAKRKMQEDAIAGILARCGC